MRMLECLHYVNGKSFEGSQTEIFANSAPASDDVLSQVPVGSAEDLDQAVESAEAALKGDWGKMSLYDRSACLERAAMLLSHQLEEFSRLESLDTGKPISETRQGDIPRAIDNFRFFAEIAKHQPTPAFSDRNGGLHKVKREALGIVGLITPWNLPLYLATWKLAPALVQGNAVILKPAELTPLTAYRLAQLMTEAGLPPGVFNVIQGYGPKSAGEALVTHPKVRAISFTGETNTGRAIMAAAAPSLKKLSFELGGKGASLICEDADLDRAVPTAVRAAFRNQGQICLAGSRLIVHRKHLDRVIEGVLSEVAKIRIGDPLDERTTMGSLISREHRNKVAAYVDAARDLPQHEVLTGGKVPEGFDKGAFYEPTVVFVSDVRSRLVKEEIFGPVLTIQAVDSDEQGVELINNTNYGLSCSIWTQDISKAERLSSAAKTGLVWVNSWFLRDLHTPFGGTKDSGIGREGGQHSLDFFSEYKTVSYAW